MITYTKAKLSDIVHMQDVVKPEVEKGIILFRSSDEMATNIRSYILAKENDQIIGFGDPHNMTKKQYHHKDLRNALIEKGIEIVNSEGLVKRLM